MKYRQKAYVLLITSIGLSILIGCGGAPYFVEPSYNEPEEGTFETLFNSRRVIIHNAGSRAVFRSPDAWADYLSHLSVKPSNEIINQLAYIDYSRHMVIGISLGAKGSGQSVRIDSVITEEDHLMVYATESIPTVHNRIVRYPAHFIVLDKVDLPVEFAPVVVKKNY